MKPAPTCGLLMWRCLCSSPVDQVVRGAASGDEPSTEKEGAPLRVIGGAKALSAMKILHDSNEMRKFDVDALRCVDISVHSYYGDTA